MGKAGLAIFICETYCIAQLMRKYYGDDWKSYSVEEFLMRASLEDVLMFSVRARSGWIGFCLMTMGRLFNV